MNDNLKQYFDKTLILTADKSKEISPKTLYHLYKEECLILHETIYEKNYFMDNLADYIFEYMGNTNEKLVLSINALVYEKYFYEIQELQNNKCDNDLIKNDLLKDNEHTFTLQTGTRDANGLKNKVLIFSTKNKKHDLDKIEAYKSNKENIEVIHNVISPKAMKILSEYIQIQEESYDDIEGLLKEYQNEYDD